MNIWKFVEKWGKVRKDVEELYVIGILRVHNRGAESFERW